MNSTNKNNKNAKTIKDKCNKKVVLDKNLGIKIIGVVLSFTMVILSSVIATNKNPSEKLAVTSNMYKLLSMSEYHAEAPIDVKESVSSKEVMTSYGLYVGEKFITADESEENLLKLVDNYLLKEKVNYDETAVVEFTSGYHTQFGFYSTDKIATSSEIEELFESCSKTVTINEVDASTLKYKTVTKKDNNKYEDYKEVTRKGKKGKAETTYRVTYVDGVETQRSQINYEVLKNPVDKIVTVGTKEKLGLPTGNFLWPTPACNYIFSGFGSREDGNHKGIDISGAGIYGTDVLASDGGTVICANFHDYGYGYHIEIDHGNGFVTRYAHLSDIYVSVGDKVEQGEVIGAVGSTGNSEGPHLHFEVIVNGSQVDPTIYVR